MKRVHVISTARGDLGHLLPLMKELVKSEDFSAKLCLLGGHGGGHGKELDFVGGGELYWVRKLPSPDGANEWPPYFAELSEKYAEVLMADPPDVVIVLGDRLELLAVAPQALALGSKIVHIHGGELTEGAIDDSVRHAISKLSSLHFVATKSAAKVLESLGESQARIHLTGALAVDNYAQLNELPKSELEALLGVKISEDSILVTFHPVTNSVDGEYQALQFFEAMRRLRAQIFITEPNHDPGSEVVRDLIGKLQSAHPRVHLFRELGTRAFYSLMQHVKAVVGNSSSGIFDAVIAGTPSLDFGSRQKSRVTCSSVVRVQEASSDELLIQVEKLVHSADKLSTAASQDFFGRPGVAKQMVKILAADETLFKPKWQIS